MATYIVFLRAINVGGRFVKMETLRGHLDDAGFGDVETHIQSGNVRLTSRVRSSVKVAQLVEQALRPALGFDVPSMVRTPDELAAVVRDAPDSPLADEARHYLFVLKDAPPPAAVARLDGWSVEGERLQVTGKDVHLWTTTPFHQVKASNARVEKLAAGPSTARDWKVISALAAKWAPA